MADDRFFDDDDARTAKTLRMFVNDRRWSLDALAMLLRCSCDALAMFLRCSCDALGMVVTETKMFVTESKNVRKMFVTEIENVRDCIVFEGIDKTKNELLLLLEATLCIDEQIKINFV